MTAKEKKLTIELLEAKIERISGKKVTYVNEEFVPFEKKDKKDKKEKAGLSEEDFKRKKKIAKTLKEMIDSGCKEEEITEILGLFKKAGQMMGTKWNQQQAEQAWNQTYAKAAPGYAQKLGIPVEQLKNALVQFMMNSGGLAILAGGGKNAEWDPASKSFKTLSSKMGGQGAFSLGTAGE